MQYMYIHTMSTESLETLYGKPTLQTILNFLNALRVYYTNIYTHVTVKSSFFIDHQIIETYTQHKVINTTPISQKRVRQA